MRVDRGRPQHGVAGAVERRPARRSPAIRELHRRGTPRRAHVRGRETSRASTVREALRRAPVGTPPVWRTTPPDYPAVRELRKGATPLVPRVRTAPFSGTCTIREPSRRFPQAEWGAP